MEVEERQDATGTSAGSQSAPSQAGRPPPIILTSATNLIQLQKKIRGLVNGNFDFRNTRSGTRVVTKDMADYSAIKSFLEKENLHFFIFHPKSLKPFKVVIRRLPSVSPAEEIYEALTDLGFDVMSVKQIMSSRRSLPEAGQKSANVPLTQLLFLITLPKNEKSQEIFKLTGLCHISIQVEAYRSINNLTQCHNCQQFGHAWANCSQPPLSPLLVVWRRPSPQRMP
jgi:hypothetical protein